jgi:hydroxypyruvate isomerase
MNTIQQSISWWCFSQMQPEALVKTAVEIGYKAVELVGQEHWALIKDHGLLIAAVNGHSTIEDGLNRRENRDRIRREIEHNLELAVKWGIPNLICFSGNRNGVDDTVGGEITAETLQAVAGMAEDANVTLVLELLNSKIDHKNYQCDHTPWGIRVCEMVGSPHVKLLYDIYHMQIMEGDIIRTIQENHAYIGHYHTAGVPGRHEIDETQELYYPAIVRAIQSTGYEGFLGQEFIPAGDPVQGLRQAFTACHIVQENLP